MKELLIIGASSDIAQAIARKYAEQNYELILTARDDNDLLDIAKDLEIRGAPKVSCMTLDVNEPSSISAFISENESMPSGIIVAIGYLGDQELAQNDATEQRKISIANYSGLIEIMEYFANGFEQRKAGFIVGISSVAGDRGRGSNYHYGAAKAAFSAYLSGLRNRLFKNGVSVTDVRPGFVDTKMTSHIDLPGPITAQPDEVANCVYKAQQGAKNIVYVKPVWRLIMLIVRNIPESIFKRLSL